MLLVLPVLDKRLLQKSTQGIHWVILNAVLQLTLRV